MLRNGNFLFYQTTLQVKINSTLCLLFWLKFISSQALQRNTWKKSFQKKILIFVNCCKCEAWRFEDVPLLPWKINHNLFLKFQTTPSWHQFSAWLTIFVRNAIWPNSSKIMFITSFLPNWDVNDNDPQLPEISTLISYQAVVVIKCVKRYTSTIDNRST